jgi:hypothetical protein
MRYQTEVYQLPAKTLNINGITTIREDFPLGDAWYEAMLEISLSLTIGSGSGAISEGELGIIKGIYLKTDTDGVIINAPGRALYRYAQVVKGCAPNKDAIAASTAVYNISIPLIFANPRLNRSEDTILDTSRYSSVEMQITLGGVADLLGTVGSASVTATANIALVKTHGTIPEGGRPLVAPYLANLPVVNPSSQTYIDLERSYDLAYGQALLFAGNSVTAGVPFSGTPSDSTLATLNVEDNYGFPVRQQAVRQNQQEAKSRYQIETWPTGWYMFDFVKDGSLFSAYPSGDKSKCQINWANNTLSTSGVTLLVSGYRQFKV